MDIEVSSRNIEIDNERSGLDQLGMNTRDAQLLKRDGEETSLKVRYNFSFGQHNLLPEITYLDFAGDGKAMAYDSINYKLTHNYNNRRFSTFSTIGFRNNDYDQINPIYGKLRTDDMFEVGFTLIDRELFGVKDWSAIANITYGEPDSNIDFYTSDLNMVSLGAMYSF